MRKTMMIVGALLLAGFIILLVIMLVFYKGPADEREEITGMKQGFDEIRVFLREDLDEDERVSFEKYLLNLKGVSTVDFVSKETVLEEFEEMYEEQQDLLEEIEGNPFPAEFKITVEDPHPNFPPDARSFRLC